MNCALCRSADTSHVATVKQRPFFHCRRCDLLFVPPDYHLSVQDERTRYALHDNTVENGGYVRFLSEVADVVQRQVVPGARLLDFGCGKHAVLAGMLRSRGMACDAWDPLYPYPALPETPTYGGIVLCEVIEHCRDLPGTIRRIGELRTPKAVVILRTQCPPGAVDLHKWWYAQDCTHIHLFSIRALEAVAARLGRALVPTALPDIFLIR